MRSANKYAVLSDACSLRLLDRPFVYNKITDDLYELDREALEFIKACDGSKKLGELGGDAGFLEFCLREGVLELLDWPYKRFFTPGGRPGRPLRYLELHITGRCNLRCRHCYLGANGGGEDLDLAKVFKAADDFEAMHGLRLLISGGEPLLHKRFWYINEKLAGYGFRSVLLTNGTLVDADVARRLKVQEAQVSLDGMEESHETIRGDDTFGAALRGIENLKKAGIAVSVATMVTAANAGEFEKMSKLVRSLGVSEWNIDVPSPSGRLRDNPELMPDMDEAARCLGYGFGGGLHLSAEGYACGSHLCAVSAEGKVARCGFYVGSPAGDITEGLANCWDRVEPLPLSRLECACGHIEECRGGCRYRAAAYTGEYGPDPVKCRAYGVDVGHINRR